MKAAVLFLTLTDEQADRVNREGWACEVGCAYTNAREKGQLDAAKKLGLYELAAGLDIDCPEQAFTALQNVDCAWADRPAEAVERVYTARPRSMSVGDLIIWANGTVQLCSAHGFHTVEV